MRVVHLAAMPSIGHSRTNIPQHQFFLHHRRRSHGDECLTICSLPLNAHVYRDNTAKPIDQQICDVFHNVVTFEDRKNTLPKGLDVFSGILLQMGTILVTRARGRPTPKLLAKSPRSQHGGAWHSTLCRWRAPSCRCAPSPPTALRIRSDGGGNGSLVAARRQRRRKRSGGGGVSAAAVAVAATRR
jgi:hypothetical protein